MSDLESLTSPNWAERRRAIAALAHSDDATLVQGLLDILRANHQDLNALNAALQLLCQVDAPVVAGLIRLLKHPDEDTRMYAALALGELRDASSIPDLLAALEDPRPNVRFNAIEALGKLRASQAIDPLLAILEEGDFYLAFPAVQALAEIGAGSPTDSGPRLIPHLLGLLDDDILALPAVRALGILGDVSLIDPIAAWLESPAGDPAVAASALCSLAQRSGIDQATGSQRQELLGKLAAALGFTARARLLASIPEQARPGAVHLAGMDQVHSDLAHLLGWLLEAELKGGAMDRAAQFRAGLVRLLSYPSAAAPAAEALARSGPQAVPEVRVALDELEPGPQQQVVKVLAAVAHPAFGSLLVEILNSGEAGLVALAADGLGRMSDPDAFEPLLHRLGHPSALVRQAVARALVALNPPDLIQRMLALLEGGDLQQREAALHTLAMHGWLTGGGISESGGADKTGTAESQAEAGEGPAVLAALADGSATVRCAAIEVLPFLQDPQATDALKGAIHSSDPALRACAARALAYCPADLALPLLHAALKDPDYWVRMFASRSLGEHAQPVSQPHLAALRQDPMPPVRIAVATALAQVGGSQAEETLQAMLADPEPDVRQAVQNTLDLLQAGGLPGQRQPGNEGGSS